MCLYCFSSLYLTAYHVLESIIQLDTHWLVKMKPVRAPLCGSKAEKLHEASVFLATASDTEETTLRHSQSLDAGLSTTLFSQTPQSSRKRRRLSDGTPYAAVELWKSGETPATLPRTRKGDVTNSLTPARPLRFSGALGETAEATPQSQLLSQLALEGGEANASSSTQISDENPLSLTWQHNETTASRVVRLKSGHTMPSPITPLWDIHSSHSNTPRGDAESLYDASQRVDLFDEPSENDETTLSRRSTLCTNNTVNELAEAVEQNVRIARRHSGTVGDADVREDYIRTTRQFFDLIDRRPLLSVVSTTPLRPAAKNHTASPAKRFEQLMAKVKRSTSTSYSRTNK